VKGPGINFHEGKRQAQVVTQNRKKTFYSKDNGTRALFADKEYWH
jgi:hypothetical protein